MGFLVSAGAMAACDEKDPRLPWINERVTVGLKLKSDRFMKMATSEVDTTTTGACAP